ncbi:helicase domain-containing protein [Thermodesulfobium narugense DSM 14796]|uniref:Helicase domain-containing protein n=1 Tax=Thermodesulfobium narugense DSM 14796 TaxID=747365 RepID=M1E827_9BACT|nr:helicase-related protein [Thermodesulfobium narugense]AEE14725.1 helicase domain-containing protein [Thermodesulfobium narugense DSM 14796]
MSNFITNSGESSLKSRISTLVKNSAELKFLVGFFYFSGLKELYESIRGNQDVILNVLVGLNVDISNFGLIEYAQNRGNLSKREIVDKYLYSLKKSINTELFDTKEFYNQSNFFVNLIKSGRLNIRKTLEPNHAKLYLFKLKDEVGRSRLFITGSSNLTSSGLSRQQEFNVEISDYGFDEAEDYFNKLWESSVEISEKDEYKYSLINTLEKETLIRKITPFEAYALVLKSYLDVFKGKDIDQRLMEIFDENGYKPYSYQLDAIKQALGIIEQSNGVLIADVVGLGKTVIACALGYMLKLRGIVIAPPGIIGDKKKSSGWWKYLEDFGLTKLGWQPYSSGDLKTVLDVVSRTKDIEVVIVDEAHRFRNQNTKDYELLKNICIGKKVILLTATPFNNKPSDIFSLLKLFVIPKKSSITLTDNIEMKFDLFSKQFEMLSYIKKYLNSSDSKKRDKAIFYNKILFGTDRIDVRKVDFLVHSIAKEIKDVIEPIIIRRNRLDLAENPNYSSEVGKLSNIRDPEEWFFELTPDQSEFYDKVIKDYFALPEDGGKFRGAIYKPFWYEKGILLEDLEKGFTKEENFQYFQQMNLYDFMRRLLVKRFESSFGAFEQSIKNFKKITEDVLKFIEKTGRYILDRDLLEKIYNKDIDEIEEYLTKYAKRLEKEEHSTNDKIYVLKEFKLKDKFIQDIKDDLNLFDNILKELAELNMVADDPKIKTLINNLKEVLNKTSNGKEPKRKAVIFTEYLDTVKYLKDILNKTFNNRVLVVEGLLSASKLRDIIENFDASYSEQKDNYDILLTTDMVSEGFNLNRAGIVVNYDIPWNPVRVIQRVGRINRISKKVFDEIYIANFFPTQKGSDLVRSRDIASNKMFMIHKALGEDSKIFDVDEEPTASNLYKKIQQNPDEIEKESFYTKVFREFEELKKEYPDIVEVLDSFPNRVKVAKYGKKDEMFVVIKKGKIFVNHKTYDSDSTEEVKSLEDIINNIRSKKDDVSLELSDRFWDEYISLRDYEGKIDKRSKNNSQSLETKAYNLLKSFQKNDKLLSHKEFINTLIEDIVEYGTLSEYTLRRLVNMERIKNEEYISKGLLDLKREMGVDYLKREKERLKNLNKEVIIAIENKRGDKQ